MQSVNIVDTMNIFSISFGSTGVGRMLKEGWLDGLTRLKYPLQCIAGITTLSGSHNMYVTFIPLASAYRHKGEIQNVSQLTY